MASVVAAIIGAILSCILALICSYIMTNYQMKKERLSDDIRQFKYKSNNAFVLIELIAQRIANGTQNDTLGTKHQELLSDLLTQIRVSAFTIQDNPHMEENCKKIVENIYTNFAHISSQPGNITQNMKNIRDGLSSLKDGEQKNVSVAELFTLANHMFNIKKM